MTDKSQLIKGICEYKILEYHVRAIATEKGIKELEKQLNINNQNK